MRHNNDRPTIGYFNITLMYDWAELPWRGAVTAAARHQVNLLSLIGNTLNDSDIQFQQGNAVYQLPRGGAIDALLFWKSHLTSSIPDDQVKAFIDQFGVPAIALEGSLAGYPSIECGNYEGIRMLMDHLVQVHGYKRIGFLGSGQNNDAFTTRRQAYLDGLKAYGLEFDPRLSAPWVIWIHEYDGRSVHDLLDEWLPGAMAAGLEALVCMADPVAWWVMEHMAGFGIRVPDDVAVVSYDAFADSKVKNPHITTIDPDYWTLGSLAVDTIMDVLKGNVVPDRIMVPPVLFLGRTCGCLEENVVRAGRAWAGKLSSLKKIIDRMQLLLPHEDRDALKNLYATFVAEARGRSPMLFLQMLERLIFADIKNGINLKSWQDVITFLNELPAERPELKDELCHQARILISNASVRQEGRNCMVSVFQMTTEREVSKEILTNFQFSEVMDLLALNLPKMGITRCYLALFDESFTYHFPDRLPEESRLVLAYDETGRIDLEPEGRFFSTCELIPGVIQPANRPANWTAFTLHFQEKQIGFIVFETGPERGVTCEFLRVFISSSLYGVMLINEKRKAYERLEQAQLELQRELDVAKNIQRALLPGSIDHEQFDIAAAMKTAIAVGGDYYDIFHVHDRDWFIIGDVSGHGVHAGLIMMMARTSIHLLVEQFPDITPCRLISLTNEAVLENIRKLKEDKYMTINILTHKANGEFFYSGMHLPILIYRQQTKTVEKIEMDGMWLGLIDDISGLNHDSRFVLERGDCLLLYTDGLIETMTRKGNIYDVRGLVDVFQSSGWKSAREIVHDIIGELCEDSIVDDVTIMAIKWSP